MAPWPGSASTRWRKLGRRWARWAGKGDASRSRGADDRHGVARGPNSSAEIRWPRHVSGPL